MINKCEPYQNFSPCFSIIILFWNSHKYIKKCLTSIQNQTFIDFEIILIDNGSIIGIDKELFLEFQNLNINYFLLEKNLGFAAANNFGASKARGDYLVLLNSDAFPKSDWLDNVKTSIEKYPNSFFASKLLMANDDSKLDGTGDVYHASGIVWRKNYEHKVRKVAENEVEVFSACAAAAVYPKYAFEEVGGFDEDYFAYVEDVDLGFRLRLAGYKCIFLPDAVVYHVGSGSTGKRSDFSVYYGQRNLVWTFIKDMPGVLFWILLPGHIVVNLLLIVLSIFRKQGRIVLQAKIDGLSHMIGIINKRRKIQKSRKVSIWEILKMIDWNPISPILKILSK